MFGVRNADMGDDVNESWRLYDMACTLAPDEPIGVTIAEWVRFRRGLAGGYYLGRPIIGGHRVVLIPSGWVAWDAVR